MAITFTDLAKNLEELRVVNMMQRRKIARRMKRLAKSSAFRKQIKSPVAKSKPLFIAS